jgi:RNA polymerase sigma-70 factor (ECF subfamily)
MNFMEEQLEKELLKQAISGDKKAIAALYDLHYQVIYRYVIYRVSDRTSAEDLTAEVFIRMIRKLPGYKDRGKPLLAWLYTIARNLVIDHHRSFGKENHLPIKDQVISDKAPGPVRRLQQRQDEQCFQKALDKLPESQRLILVYRFIEEFPTPKILELMGKSDRAIRSLQHRALRSLDKALREEKCI